MDSGFIKYLRSQLNKPSARKIHASDSGAYLTGPNNHGTQQTQATQVTLLSLRPQATQGSGREKKSISHLPHKRGEQ